MEGLVFVGMVAVAVISAAVVRRRTHRVLRILDARGADAARAELDRLIPPVTRAGSFRQRVKQEERYAGLAVIGRGDVLAEEMASVTGTPWEVAMLKRVGLLGIAVSVDSVGAAHQLQQLADEVEQNGDGRTAASLRVEASAVRCFHEDGELSDEAEAFLRRFAGGRGLSRVLGMRALSLALRQVGRSSEAVELDAKIRKYTRVFD